LRLNWSTMGMWEPRRPLRDSTLYRDKTWRYLASHVVGYGAEKPFDRSWQTVVPLISLWLAEVKGAHGALDV
jgi:hypothetical protein